MSLKSYYEKPLWKRAVCHIIPMIVSLFVGAFSIMALDRDDPVAITWGKVIPPVVAAGEPVTFHYGSIRHHDYGGNIKRWIVDVHGQVFTLADTGESGNEFPMYKESEVVKHFDVPCGISVGPATYHSDAALYAKWNFMQRLFPIHREIHYPFIVKLGTYDNACAGHAQQGPQDVK